MTRSATRPLSTLDWIAVVLLLAGIGCVLGRSLPGADADATIRRILPLLLFLATIIVLAELTAVAGVFDVIATRLAIIARGNFLALFALCTGFGALTTMGLNLDTTAVLLTPVMLALARSLDVPALPLAMCTVWQANTASLLLPVSNLTNLLAANRVGLTPLAFAGRMEIPQAAVLAATAALLWVFYWSRHQRGADRYLPPPQHAPADRVLFWVTSSACLLFVVAILAGVELGIASAIAAGAVIAAFTVRDRAALRWSLIPWRLPVFVTGLFLVMQTISLHFLGSITSALISPHAGIAGWFRAAATGAGLANLVNNLPAYVVGETTIPQANHAQLLSLLIGVNVGPIITPWASLATLIWYERCHAAGVRVPLRKFMLTGACLAAVGIATGVAALAA